MREATVAGASALERRVVALLAFVVSARMLGLFMLLPVLTLYGERLAGPRPMLIGLALGIYGLTQAGLQIPLGRLSDRIGRKPVLAGGLLIFAAGSVLAAVSDSITGVIAGRALQGAGAISAALFAWLADLTRPVYRTRSMAVVGFSIGFSFLLALMLGPALDRWIGVPGLFWTGAGLALVALVVVLTGIPEPVRHERAKSLPLGNVLNWQLAPIFFGIFVLHLTLTALFVAAPYLLRDQLGIAEDGHWRIYLGVLLVSLTGTVPLILWSERTAHPHRVHRAAIVLLGIACLVLSSYPAGRWPALAAMACYFAGFNFLEARLPALVSLYTPATGRGGALGVYATSQFLGAFAGGLIGGWILGRANGAGVFLASTILVVVWLLLSLKSTKSAPISR